MKQLVLFCKVELPRFSGHMEACGMMGTSMQGFVLVVTKFVGVLFNTETVSIGGAGHYPYETHPDAYVEAVTTFIHKHSAGQSASE